jgi:hypothetical protein
MLDRLSAALAILASFASSARATPQLTAVSRDVHVTVHDVEAGVPLAGAAVTCSHSSAIAVTDAKGIASFLLSLPDEGSAVHFFATARGRAPIFAREFVDSDDEHIGMCMPRLGQHLSPSIAAAAGGAYTIRTAIGTTPVEMEISVAPGALPFDGHLDVTPYPGWATRWKNSDDPEDYRLAYFHVALRDAQGRLRPDTDLTGSVEVRLRPWVLSPTGDGSLVTTSEYFVPRIFDPATGMMIPASPPAAHSPATNSLAWTIDSVGIHGIGVSFPPELDGLWVGDVDPAHAGAVGVLRWLFGADLLDPTEARPSTVDGPIEGDDG